MQLHQRAVEDRLEEVLADGRFGVVGERPASEDGWMGVTPI